MQNNIFPFQDKLVARLEKEKLLGQKSKVFWFTGLSGAGKSTLALGLEKKLHEAGYLSLVLDGDNIRSGINNNLGFSAEDRMENIRRIAEVSKLILSSGVIVICAFVSPTNNVRDLAKSIIGVENFVEIYVNTPIEECERRDVKGLYKKARNGEINNFTGISAPFDIPTHPDLAISTKNKMPTESIEQVFDFALTKISKVD